MEDRQVINDSYYCGRMRQNAIVSVLTGNSYVVAEYDERTGDIRWQRVVNASQKEGIHNWLREHFPVKGESAKMPVGKGSAAKVAPLKAAPVPEQAAAPVKAAAATVKAAVAKAVKPVAEVKAKVASPKPVAAPVKKGPPAKAKPVAATVSKGKSSVPAKKSSAR